MPLALEIAKNARSDAVKEKVAGGEHGASKRESDSNVHLKLTCDTRKDRISESPEGRTERTVNVSFAAATAC